MAVELTDKNFQTTVLNSDKVAIVDFWAEWCKPCVAIAPMVKEIAEQYEGRAIVGKVDVTKNKELQQKYRITSIPTFIVFKNGVVVDRWSGGGEGSRSIITNRLDKYIEDGKN